jgi:hypothetical protein
MNMVFLPLLFLVIFGGLGIAFLAIALVSRRKAQTSQSWPTVAARVLASEVREHVSHEHDSDNMPSTQYSYEPVVEYNYAVGAQTYISRRIAYGANSFGRGQAQKMVESYPVGSVVTAHYNPANPSEAVLETKAAGGALFLILGIVFMSLCAMSGCLTVVLALVQE